MRSRLLVALAALALASPLPLPAVDYSRPQPQPIERALPAARDIPYPGTITLTVNATDVARGIFRVRQSIPVAAAGPLYL
ncbi:MAG: peptidase M61, partial [Sphingomonadales bacterium]